MYGPVSAGREKHMDSRLEQIALEGSWVDKDDPSISRELREDMTGDRRRYVFTCPYCDREMMTDRTYRFTDNIATDTVKSGFFWKVQDLIWQTLYRIPLVGHALGRRVEEKVDAREDAMEDRRERKTLLRAFEEVSDEFEECERCGRYTCSSCIEDGVCGFCRDKAAMEEARGMAAGQEGEEEGG